MKLQIGFEIINSYKRLAYKAWYALAEYVDNSTQAYKNNEQLLGEALAMQGVKLRVDITYEKNGNDYLIEIKDNSMGMSLEDLENAVVIGKPPVIKNGRSKYGLGMKTASFWLGNEWSVITKKLGETVEHTVNINANTIAETQGELDYSKKGDISPELHYTKIKVTDLNQKFSAKTEDKIKDYLKSIYRYDLYNGDLELYWQNEKLVWDYSDTYESLEKLADGEEKKPIQASIGDKKVRGWAGVIAEGASRSKAGFSILQNNRVIIGWPDAYKPESLFGPQKGGSNDLVNQRLVGELFLDDFRVSHTKDEIIYENDEEDELDFLLGEHFGDLKAIAKIPKKSRLTSIPGGETEFLNAIASFEQEFNSPEIVDSFNTFEIPDEEMISENNQILIENVKKSSIGTYEVKLGSLTVNVFIEDEISAAEMYLAISIHSNDNTLDVLINKNHPHWRELTKEETILNYIRHCVYDGVSEWKAYKVTGKVEPDTVKIIKDNLLRASFKFQEG